MLRVLIAIGLLLGSAFDTTPASASEFSVQPLRVTLSDTRPNASVRVNNLGTEPVQVQAKVLRWTQRNGENIYEEAPEIITNPPLFRLNGSKSQLLRFGMLDPRPTEQERAYRIFLQEVPAPTRPSDGVQTLLRISLPIFISGTATGKPGITGRLIREGRVRRLVGIAEGALS